MDTVKATIVIGDKTVTFEGPADFVQSQVEKYATHMPSELQVKNTKGDTVEQERAPMSERQLVAQKKPKNHTEIVAVLAFSLAENGKETFTEEDIKKAYIRADVRPPKVISQAIRDAKNVCDFVEPGPERGTWRLTTHGDRTVRYDLPRSE